MAMVDYPYPTDFLTPMPGYPATFAAQFLNKTGAQTDQELSTSLYSVASVYYNYTQSMATFCIDPSVCGDAATAALGSPYGWPWQECTEIIIEMCERGPPNDFYLKNCPDGDNILDFQRDFCVAMFQPFGYDRRLLRERATPVMYGMNFAGASNMILTNGALDPWSAGGVLSESPGVDKSRGVHTLLIPGAAHHLDLRQPNTCDPNTVKNARFQIVNILKCWLTNDFCDDMHIQALPDIVIPTNVECKDDVNAFPWGQVASVAGPSAAIAASFFIVLLGALFAH